MNAEVLAQEIEDLERSRAYLGQVARERLAQVASLTERVADLEAELARVREALSRHPRVCNRPVQEFACGWRATVADIETALGGDQ